MQVAKLQLNQKGTILRYRWSSGERYTPMEFRRDLGERGVNECKTLMKQAYEITYKPDSYNEPVLGELGYALYKLLIPEDLHPLLHKHQEPLIIYGGDIQFPWELLHDGEQFLGLRFPIGRLPSWFEPQDPAPQILPKIHKNKINVLMISDPLSDLPQSKREIEFLSDTLPTHLASKIFSDKNATYEGLKSSLSVESKGGTLLHIASSLAVDSSENRHIPSILLKDSELSPRLLRSAIQGALWAFLHLDSPLESTLKFSTTITSYATTLLDEGLFGVVVGLNSHFSTSTRQIISYYYRHLLDGVRPAEALMRARVDFWKRDPDNPAWASFVFFGDPRVSLFKEPETDDDLLSVRSFEKIMPDPIGSKIIEPSSQSTNPKKPKKATESALPNDSNLEYDFDLEQAIGIALMEAKNLRQDFIGTPHLFIGLTKCPGGVTRALLESVGFESKKVRDTIRYALGFGHASLDSKILPTQRCARALKTAEQNARDEDDHVVREKHLLAAILQSGEGLAFEVLKKMGADPNKLSEKLVKGDIPQIRNRQGGSTPTIDRYGRDLTLLAEKNELPHLTGRSEELMRLAQILLRRFKNNPLIIGEAGVGKTALVEGVAQRIIAGAVPKELQNRRLVELSLSGLVAGTRYRGDFEERLTTVIREAHEHPEVILFLDEFHTVVGAGETHQGTLDAANILKPALARGELRCIGATTPIEYRKYIEKDAALARRFHPLFLEEPTPEDSVEILKGSRLGYEEHHHVTISDDVLELAVELAVRYLPDRRLPDKALDLIDEACALVTLRGSSTPMLTSDGKIRPMPNEPVISENTIFQVLADWTGIPVGELSKEESKRLLSLTERLTKSVLGQKRAVETTSQVVQIGRAGLKREGRPTAVLLFIGPSGVGKTELCRALARELFGQESAIIRLDMSEFSEKHSTAKLVGAPPGYVGYGEEGQILSQLHYRPYSVVLLDEIEKAHFEVLDLFLQLFEEGRLTDSLGRTIDGRHAVFIMTSNILADRFQKRHSVGFQREGEATIPNSEIKTELKSWFRPEFLNRIDETILFHPLEEDVLFQIARKHFEELAERALQQGMMLSCNEDALMKLAKDSYEPTLGARPLIRAIEEYVARPLSRMLLSFRAKEPDSDDKGVQARFCLIDGYPTLVEANSKPLSFTRSINPPKDTDKV